jgi:hypothetical protein
MQLYVYIPKRSVWKWLEMLISVVIYFENAMTKCDSIWNLEFFHSHKRHKSSFPVEMEEGASK